MRPTSSEACNAHWDLLNNGQQFLLANEGLVANLYDYLSMRWCIRLKKILSETNTEPIARASFHKPQTWDIGRNSTYSFSKRTKMNENEC